MAEQPSPESIFDAVRNIANPVERAAYLDGTCGNNAELRRRVERLLAAHAEAGSFLDRPAFRDEPATGDLEASHSSASSEAGTVIAGKYKLLERIGAGGMGTVWMAQQTEPIKRLVAVKLIKAGMDSKQVLTRFDAERQALAVMEHPNVAKILDGGVSEKEAPFFVMELVKGIPITKYCDERKLTPQQRLELFVPVCQAIQHAHQKGIIHRDIKPSNVLVAMYDDRPVPKVIDFGVAKATGQRLSEQTLVTGFGAVLGTPEYMSPEQASFNQLDVDTRSDVYSLGVLLYELLAGSPPFSRKELEHAGMLEILRVIREQEPSKPSTKLSTAEKLPSLAAQRGTEPKKLTALVRGELDWIVMKALEKDRTRRYETANGFAADINRYLTGEPVQAVPPSAAYRMSKFVRRNMGAVIAASAVLLAVLSGAGIATWQAVVARRAEAKAVDEKNRADEEAEIAKAVKEFLQEDVIRQAVSRFQAVHKVEVKPDLTLREALDRAAARIGDRFRGQELTEAAIRLAIGEAYRGVGAAADGISHLERAVELFQRKLGADHHHTLNAVHNLANCQLAAGHHDQALALYLDTFERLKDVLGTDDWATLRTMQGVGVAYHNLGNLDQAISIYERVVDAMKQKNGADHVDTIHSMCALASGYYASGKYQQAIALHQAGLKFRTAHFGPDHPDTLETAYGLAMCYKALEKWDLAVPLLESTLKHQEIRLPKEHPEALNTKTDLGACYSRLGKHDLAVRFLQQVFEIRKRKLGIENPDTLKIMGELANGYDAAGKIDKALPLYEEAHRLRLAKLGRDHPNTLRGMNDLGRCYCMDRKYDLAAPQLKEAVELAKVKYGLDHPETLTFMSNLAATWFEMGKPELALPLFEEAHARRKAILGADAPDTLNSLDHIAIVHGRAGRFDLSLPVFEQILNLRRDRFGPDHPETLHSMCNLGATYYRAGKFDLAIATHEESLRRRKALLGIAHPQTLLSMYYLAKCYESVGRENEALPLFEEAWSSRKTTSGAEHPDTLSVMHDLGVCLWRKMQFDRSIPLWEELLRVRARSLGDEHKDVFDTAANLAMNYAGAKRFEEAIPLLEKAYLKSSEHPSLKWVTANLANVYVQAGRNDAATAIYKDMLAEARQLLTPDNPQLAAALALVGKQLLDGPAYSEAEPFLRECLTIREKAQPDAWTTFNTQSMLGASLAGQKKFADAEPLLVSGFEGMKQREATIPTEGKIRIPESLERLVKLYDDWGKPDEAAKWRAELESRNSKSTNP